MGHFARFEKGGHTGAVARMNWNQSFRRERLAMVDRSFGSGREVRMLDGTLRLILSVIRPRFGPEYYTSPPAAIISDNARGAFELEPTCLKLWTHMILSVVAFNSDPCAQFAESSGSSGLSVPVSWISTNSRPPAMFGAFYKGL